VRVVRSGAFFTGAFGMRPADVFGVRRVVGMGGVFTRVFLVVSLIMGVVIVSVHADGSRRRHTGGFDRSRIGRGHRLRRLARLRMDMPVIGMRVLILSMLVMVRMLVMVMIMMLGIIMMSGVGLVKFGVVKFGVVRLGMIVFGVAVAVVRLGGLRRTAACVLDDLALDALATAAAARVAVARTAPVGTIFGFFLGLAMGAFVGFDQRLTIGDRNLVIVRMDFAEGEKAVTVAAVLDEGSLQGRLYARDLGEIDIAA
jgi:hypothetical protein